MIAFENGRPPIFHRIRKSNFSPPYLTIFKGKLHKNTSELYCRVKLGKYFNKLWCGAQQTPPPAATYATDLLKLVLCCHLANDNEFLSYGR